MNVSCDDCRSVFRVDPAKIPPAGVRARCSVCGAIMRIAPPKATPVRSLTPALGMAASAFEASASAAAPEPAYASAGASAAVATPVVPPYVPSPARVPTPRTATPVSVPAPFTRVTPALPPLPAAPATPATPAAPMPWSVPSPSPVARPTPMPASVAATTPVAPSAVNAPAPAAAPAAAPAGAPSTSGRRINPFMTADPNQRARRLARALVSDIVAYHPQKRDDGLRNGTLKQLFRDEIKKSYEEYVEQVGRELAESTSHFQDALNEVLASGRRLF